MTFDRYQDAMWKYIGCASMHGYAVREPPRLNFRNQYDPLDLVAEWSHQPTAEERNAQVTALSDCFERYFRTIQDAWLSATEISRPERLLARSKVALCLRSKGYLDVPTEPGDAALLNFIVPDDSNADRREALRNCLTELQDEIGLRYGEVP